MALTKAGIRIQQIHQEREMIWGQVKAVVEPAASEERYLTEDEDHIFMAGCAKLDELLEEQRQLERAQAMRDHPGNEGEHADVNTRLRRDQLDLHARKIKNADAARVQQENINRTRDLQRKLESIEVDQKIKERQIQLDHHRRRAQQADLDLAALQRRLET
ncbi:hypothetical protein [Mycobacterium sp. HNNTM2301]|uniref:hypothetical protein n=1 Tax=Mycobacterium hainanense TaxID=3289775 RepID=UPI0035A70775